MLLKLYNLESLISRTNIKLIMNQNKIRNLQNLEIDDFIWYIYIFIVVASLYSNKLEREYLLSGNMEKYREFHSINLVVLTIGFLIYVYFVYRGYELYQKKRDYKSTLNLISAILFLVAGGILLYLELQGGDLENELGI